MSFAKKLALVVVVGAMSLMPFDGLIDSASNEASASPIATTMEATVAFSRSLSTEADIYFRVLIGINPDADVQFEGGGIIVTAAEGKTLTFPPALPVPDVIIYF